jgi:HlyD family secretion protein
MKDFTKMKAPVDAVVLEIADRSVGSVLREAETLVTLVPDDADLYVEANIPSRDVSYVKVGNTVSVKLETYPFQRYGTLTGRLDVISADSVPLKADDPKSELVYRAQVHLTDSVRALTKRGIHLRPGLVATAEIKTGKRSIASYVLNPILRTADEGMREP